MSRRERKHDEQKIKTIGDVLKDKDTQKRMKAAQKADDLITKK